MRENEFMNLKENKKQSVVQFYEYIVAYFKDYKKNL